MGKGTGKKPQSKSPLAEIRASWAAQRGPAIRAALLPAWGTEDRAAAYVLDVVAQAWLAEDEADRDIARAVLLKMATMADRAELGGFMAGAPDRAPRLLRDAGEVRRGEQARAVREAFAVLTTRLEKRDPVERAVSRALEKMGLTITTPEGWATLRAHLHHVTAANLRASGIKRSDLLRVAMVAAGVPGRGRGRASERIKKAITEKDHDDEPVDPVERVRRKHGI